MKTKQPELNKITALYELSLIHIQLDPEIGRRIARGEDVEILPQHLQRVNPQYGYGFENGSGNTIKRCSNCGYTTTEAVSDTHLLPWLMPETYLFLPCLRDSLILYHSYFSSVSLNLYIYYFYYNTTSPVSYTHLVINAIIHTVAIKIPLIYFVNLYFFISNFIRCFKPSSSLWF